MVSNGIISQDRVKAYGEVFTPDSIVNDMIDMVEKSQNTDSYEDYISKTFLEPACGDGQFLIRILYRKLERVQKLPVEQRALYLIKSLCTIYGVDIQSDNVEKAKARMYAISTGKKVETFDRDNEIKTIHINLGIEYNTRLEEAIKFILNKNIVCGNTLDTNGNIIFLDYQFNGNRVKAVECPLADLSLQLAISEEVDFINLPSVEQSLEEENETFDF